MEIPEGYVLVPKAMDADRIRRIALADAAVEIQKLHDVHNTDALRIYQ